MRKFLCVVPFLFAACLAAQPNNPSIQPTSSSPSGNACAAGVPMLYNAGTYYGCDGTGHYAALGGGGSGTVSGQAANIIPLSTAATTIGAQSNISVNTTALATPAPFSAAVTACDTDCTATWTYQTFTVNAYGTSALSTPISCTSASATTVGPTDACTITFPVIAGKNCGIYRTNSVNTVWGSGAFVNQDYPSGNTDFATFYTHSCDGSTFKDDTSTVNSGLSSFQQGSPYGTFPIPNPSSTGYVAPDRVVTNEIGIGSSAVAAAFAAGQYASASGNGATAIGPYATSPQEGAISIGMANAGWLSDIAIGFASHAQSTQSNGEGPAIAIGFDSVAGNDAAIAIGAGAVANGHNGIAIGGEANAANTASIAIGQQVQATADNSGYIAVGPGGSHQNSVTNTLILGAYDATELGAEPGLIINGNIPAGPGAFSGTVKTAQGYNFMLLGAQLVSALPTCSSTYIGSRMLVADSTSAVPGTALTGSGTFTIAAECIFHSVGSAYSWIVD